MASLNKVILIGNCGGDPQMRKFPDQTSVANLSIATKETWKDKQTGEKREATEWHNLQFTGKLADIVGQYVKKGTLIYVEGKLKTRKYQKNGIDMYATDVHCDQMQMLGGNPGGGQQGAYQQQAQQSQSRPAQHAAPQQQASGFSDFDDDIPF